MTSVFGLSLLLICYVSPGQAKPAVTRDSVSFIVTLNIANASKDGIYLNGCVVNIPYEKAKKLHGKRIRVTGRVTIIEGINNKTSDTEQQGRKGITRYIESPKIEILKY